jgi:hypothetical protein
MVTAKPAELVPDGVRVDTARIGEEPAMPPYTPLSE